MEMEEFDDDIEGDILKLKLHSFPLDLNFEEVESDDEDEPPDVSPPTPTPQDLDSTIFSDEESQDEEQEELIDLSEDLPPTPINLLKLNLAYQEVLEQEVLKVDQLLKENRSKVSLILESEERIVASQKMKLSLPGPTFMLKGFFKNERDCSAPNAEIERRNMEVGESYERNLMPPTKWKKSAKQALISGVERESRRIATEPLLSKLEYLKDKLKVTPTDELKDKIRETQKQLDEVGQMDPAEMVGPRDKEWDWDSIANIDLEAQVTPTNCRNYWVNHLHPSINNNPWTADEDKKFLRLLEKHNDRNWLKISAELGSGRTVLQCAQRYQQNFNVDFKKKPWTPEEDALVMSLITKYRVGPCIPYSMIMFKMRMRTAAQIVHRWGKSLDPSFKKSRWTPEEDAALLKAVSIHGERWARIRDLNFIPGRHDGQIRERYKNALSSWKGGPWTAQEDRKLVKLVERHGEKWASICPLMSGRTDSQCAKRFHTVRNAVVKGRPLLYNPDSQHFQTILKLRRSLATKIKEEHTSVKTEKSDFEMGDFPSEGPPPKRLIKISSKKKRNLPDDDTLASMTKGLSSAEVLKLYTQANTRVSKRVESWKSPRLLAINKEWKQFLAQHHRPIKRNALYTSEHNAFQALGAVVGNSTSITAKDIFIHYIKALNINATKALQSIKVKKQTAAIRNVKLKTLLGKEVENEMKNLNEMKSKMTGRPNTRKSTLLPFNVTKNDDITSNDDANDDTATKDSDNSDVTTKRRPFIRNLYLPLCAPNRATTNAYHVIVKDREARVTRAKSILHIDDATNNNDVERSNKTNGGSSNDVTPTNGETCDVTPSNAETCDVTPSNAETCDVTPSNAETCDVTHKDHVTPKTCDVTKSPNGKFKAEEILADMRANYGYKVFRSRFNALFTWPTFLRSLVPYKRSDADGALRPVVRIKRRTIYDVKGPSSKRRKVE